MTHVSKLTRASLPVGIKLPPAMTSAPERAPSIDAQLLTASVVVTTLVHIGTRPAVVRVQHETPTARAMGVAMVVVVGASSVVATRSGGGGGPLADLLATPVVVTASVVD